MGDSLSAGCTGTMRLAIIKALLFGLKRVSTTMFQLFPAPKREDPAQTEWHLV